MKGIGWIAMVVLSLATCGAKGSEPGGASAGKDPGPPGAARGDDGNGTAAPAQGPAARAPPVGAAGGGRGAPRKLALLVGINAYGDNPVNARLVEEDRWPALAGSLHDVEAMARVLEKRHGFEVTILTDERATREAILQGLGDLAARVGPGDVAVFHFSGHGQQVTDDNGPPDEADGLDEAIVPFDNLGVVDYRMHIRDDELGLALDAIQQKTENLVVILDSCHSGTATRAARPGSVGARGAPPRSRPAARRGPGLDDGGGFASTGAGYVLFSAARPDQLAKETLVGDRIMGVLTRLMVEELERLTARTTYADVHRRLAARAPAITDDQSPQVEGNTARVVFRGLPAVTRTDALLVEAPRGDATAPGALVIAAGRLHGLETSQELALFAFGATSLLPAHAIGRARLDTVSATSSMATLLTGDAKSVEKGALALPTTTVPPALRKRVKLEVEQAALTQALADYRPCPGCAPIRYVQLVEGNGPFDFRVAQTSCPGAAAGAPRGCVEIADESGQPILIPRGDDAAPGRHIERSAPDLGPRVWWAIHFATRKRQLLALQPPLQDELDVRLVAHTATPVPGKQHVLAGRPGCRVADYTPDATSSDSGVILLPAGADGQVVGRLVFDVVNRSATDVWFGLVAINADRTVSVLLPRPPPPHKADCWSGLNFVKAGATTRIDTAWAVRAPNGDMHVKLIAATQPIDLLGLELKSHTRRRGPSALLDIIEDAGRAERRERGGPDAELSADEPWAADAITIQIGR